MDTERDRAVGREALDMGEEDMQQGMNQQSDRNLLVDHGFVAWQPRPMAA